MKSNRPAPSDLDSVAAAYTSVRDIARHYGTGPRQATRWMKESGFNLGNYKRPAPDDLATMAKTMTIKALGKHYGAGDKVVKRWLTETGVTPYFCTKPFAKLPADFARVAPTMSKVRLKAYYRTSDKVLSRWMKESGVRSLAYIPTAPMGRGGNIRPSRGNGGSNVVQFRNKSIYEEAADVLRRFGPVSRCDEKGVYSQGGNFWLVGRVMCDGDELLARAERAKRKAA